MCNKVYADHKGTKRKTTVTSRIFAWNPTRDAFSYLSAQHQMPPQSCVVTQNRPGKISRGKKSTLKVSYMAGIHKRYSSFKMDLSWFSRPQTFYKHYLRPIFKMELKLQLTQKNNSGFSSINKSYTLLASTSGSCSGKLTSTRARFFGILIDCSFTLFYIGNTREVSLHFFRQICDTHLISASASSSCFGKLTSTRQRFFGILIYKDSMMECGI
ncbi:hypothetical protein PUN28_003585 [Cardiocondyla obscurior]|uniref:Uncharacterized protein n=1 Tax=Cardiocondyla obscurior TaxID=286306 RepID=A0AAW2GLR1_9HYME